MSVLGVRTAEVQIRIARFAQGVANGYSVGQAGRHLGLTKGQTAHVWRTIKADLGAQAV